MRPVRWHKRECFPRWTKSIEKKAINVSITMEAGEGGFKQKKKKKYNRLQKSHILSSTFQKKKQTSYPLFLGKFDPDFTFCPILTFRTFLLLIAMAMVPWGTHPYLPLVGKHYKHVPSRKWSIIRYFYAWSSERNLNPGINPNGRLTRQISPTTCFSSPLRHFHPSYLHLSSMQAIISFRRDRF